MPDTLDPTTLRKGDKVTFGLRSEIKSDATMSGTVLSVDDAMVTLTGHIGVSLAVWVPVSIEKPPLPTRPGFYVSNEGSLYSLSNTGQWHSHTLSGTYTFDMSEVPGIKLYPLIRSNKAIVQRLSAALNDITYKNGDSQFVTRDVVHAREILSRLIEELSA